MKYRVEFEADRKIYCCYECPLYQQESNTNDFDYCSATSNIVLSQHRPDDCPLVEVND